MIMNRWRISIPALAVFFADQLSKWAIMGKIFLARPIENHNFAEYLISFYDQVGFRLHEMTSYFNLVMVWNHGVSFGLFNDGDMGLQRILLIVIAAIISIVVLFWAQSENRRRVDWAAGLIIGGALGNIWDRIRFGAVADFFDVHYAGFHWPAFNIADSVIVLGVLLIAIDQLFTPWSNKADS